MEVVPFYVYMCISALTTSLVSGARQYYFMDNARKQCGTSIPYVVGPDTNDTTIVTAWDPEAKIRNYEDNSCTITMKAFPQVLKNGKLQVSFLGPVYFQCNKANPLGVTKLTIRDGSSSSSLLRVYTCGSDLRQESSFSTSGDHLTVKLSKGNRFDARYMFEMKVTASYESVAEIDGLSTGAIVGIVIAVVLIVAVLAVTVFFMIRTFDVACGGGLAKHAHNTSSTTNIPGAMSGEVFVGQENMGFQESSPQRGAAASVPANISVSQEGVHFVNPSAKEYSPPYTKSTQKFDQYANDPVRFSGYDNGIDIMEESPRARRRGPRNHQQDFVDIELNETNQTVEAEVNCQTPSGKNRKSAGKRLPDEFDDKYRLPSLKESVQYTTPSGGIITASSKVGGVQKPTKMPSKESKQWERADSYYVATANKDMGIYRPSRGAVNYDSDLQADRFPDGVSDVDSGISSRSNSDRFLKTYDDEISIVKTDRKSENGIKIAKVKDTFV